MKVVRSAFLSLLLVLIPVISFAATTKSITLTDPVSVGSTVLKPGDYKVEWDGTGSNVQVKFMQNHKAVATVPATVQNSNSSYDGALDLHGANQNTKTLHAIDFKNVTLVFDQGSSSAGQ